MDKFICAHGIECEVMQIYGWNSVVHKTPMDKSKKKEYCPIHDKMNTLELEEILEAFGESGATYFDKDFVGSASKILAIAKTENQDDEKLDGLSFAFSKLKDAHKEKEKNEQGEEVEMNKYSKLVEDQKHDERVDALKKETLSTVMFDEANTEKTESSAFSDYLSKIPGVPKKNKK